MVCLSLCLSVCPCCSVRSTYYFQYIAEYLWRLYLGSEDAMLMEFQGSH